jgi:hypothetical protein
LPLPPPANDHCEENQGLSRAMRLRRLPPGWSSSSFI